MSGLGGERVMDVNGLDREPGKMSGSFVRFLWRWLPGLLMAIVSVSVHAQTVEYIHTDALGTPVAVTNSVGTVIERNDYEPYGKLLSGPIKDGPGFTGHVQDAATGLTYMQQRYYDPTIGRFLSVDPVAANGNTGANFNRYWYANNNPYKFIDPDGRKGCVASRIQSTCDSLAGTSSLGSLGSAGGVSANKKFAMQSAGASSPKGNSSQALLNRFTSGEGGSESLKDLGLEDEIKNSSVTREVLWRFQDQIKQKATQMSWDHKPGSYKLDVSFKRSYDFSSVRIALGTATLSGSFSGYVDISGALDFRYSGNAFINFFDRFQDPWDVGNNFQGEWNAGGAPYDIRGSWLEIYEGRWE